VEYKDYYAVMGVAKDAGQDEIKRAYRKLARKYHPDVSSEPDAEDRFKEVGEAYEVLKDPEKRAAYDQLGANWKAGQDFKAPPDWDGGFEFKGGDFTGGDAEHFSDFFESLFGQREFHGGYSGRSTRGFNARGEDAFAKVVIDLEDVFTGAKKAVTLTHREIDADGRPVTKDRTLNVRIPKGIRQGQHIRLAKQGNPGLGDGESGDLLLEVQFKPHPRYRAEGKNIFLDLPVAPWEAALGATVEVPTPGGSVDLKIPAGSSGGQKLRLKGRGIPAASPGDLYAVLQIALPKADSDAVRDAYRALEKAAQLEPSKQTGGG